MTPREFRRVAIEVFGQTGWQSKAAEWLGVDGSSVRRWVSGAVPVPNPVAAAMRCALARKKDGKQ